MSRLPRLLVLVLLVLAPTVRADVRPHALISEGMVLQQGRTVRLWGTADPDEKIVVRFRGQEAKTVASGGRWAVRVDSGAAGGPFPLTLAGKNTLVFRKVLVGEVWLCSGQSNMGWPLAPRPGAAARRGTENSHLRLFTVPARAREETPRDDLPGGRWLECGPDTIGPFSAVAYFFGRDLQKALGVPVGLIHASYGGSSATQWLNPATLARDPGLEHLRRRLVKPVLYNGMIAPLVPYALRGVLWYQGEADTGAPAAYGRVFPALIRGWRAEWGQGDFPFLFVQLAPYGKIVHTPQESRWAELREVQRLTSQTVPGTGMVVITDFGHETDIHPKPKEPVGQRLALATRALVYAQPVVASGPAYAGMKVEGSQVVLTFRHVGGGLEARPLVREGVVTNPRTGQTGGALHVRAGAGGGMALQGFTLAGEEGRFVNAEAEIRGDQVIVRSPQVDRPIAVRYGWADYPTGNLFNRAGLPASPFRTDSFPLPGAPGR